MKIILQLSLCCVLATGAYAQRGGGGGAPGGSRGSGGMGGGGMRGGFRGPGSGPGGGGSSGGGFHRGGSGFGGFTHGSGGFSRGFGGFGGGQSFARGRFLYGNSYGFVYPSWGFGLGLGYSSWPYSYSGYSYPAYDPSGNVTVVYPQAAPPAPVSIYVERATPVMHEYDASGLEVTPSSAASSPIYLIAFKDHVIHAAASYRVEGGTLYYVTLDREEKRVGLDSIDRPFTLQLNRERRVPFQLPE